MMKPLNMTYEEIEDAKRGIKIWYAEEFEQLEADHARELAQKDAELNKKDADHAIELAQKNAAHTIELAEKDKKIAELNALLKRNGIA